MTVVKKIPVKLISRMRFSYRIVSYMHLGFSGSSHKEWKQNIQVCCLHLEAWQIAS